MNFPQTARIRIQPLSVEEIRLYLREDFSFEKHFRLKEIHQPVPPPLRVAMEERTIPNLEKFPEHHLFYTHWTVVDHTINTAVAGIVLKGPPNENGEVEIGYGTLADFTGRDYMKETVKVFCEWVFLQQGVKKIVALTSPENIASQKILEWNGFEMVKKEEKDWHWELKKKSDQQ
jgi:ribosomal-protein-alanine N-acetyltransferase